MNEMGITSSWKDSLEHFPYSHFACESGLTQSDRNCVLDWFEGDCALAKG